MPDIFVPSDTIGVTSYYINVSNAGLIQKYAYIVADRYRKLASSAKSVDQLMRILPRDETLLNNFVEYAAQNGVPARWYYINRSRDLLLNQLKAVITRDLLGYDSFIEVLNRHDPTIDRALKSIVNKETPKSFTKSTGKISDNSLHKVDIRINRLNVSRHIASFLRKIS